MTLSASARWALRAVMAAGLVFIYVPLLLVLVNSFNGDRTFAWPPRDLTTRWWSAAWENEGARQALVTASIRASAGGLSAVPLSFLVVGIARHVESYAGMLFHANAVELLDLLRVASHGTRDQGLVVPPSTSRLGLRLHNDDFTTMEFVVAVLMGIVGLVPGALGGLAVAWVINVATLPDTGHPVEFVIHPLLIGGSLAAALAIVLAVAWMPAERAARLELIDALHYE